MITVPAEKVGLPFTEDETVWALEKAGRHPFFIQRVCHYLFEEKLLQGKSEIGEHRVLELAYYDLRSHFQNTWENLSEEQHEILQDEAQQRENHNRRLPELSESALFRQFVRHTCQTKVFKMTADELEHALEIRDNAEALGRTELRLMNLVSQRLSKDVLPSVAEKGTTVRAVLDEAFERLRGQAVRKDSDPALQGYNILYYRYFKYHLKHDQIAARIGTSARQYFRSRTRAIEALLNVLWEMENASSKEE